MFTLHGCRRRRVWEESLLQDNIWRAHRAALLLALHPSPHCDAMLSEKKSACLSKGRYAWSSHSRKDPESQRKDARLIPKNRMFIGHTRCRQGREGYSSEQLKSGEATPRNRRRCLSSRSRCRSARNVENRCMPQRRSWPGVTSGILGASSAPCATRSQKMLCRERERREKGERNIYNLCHFVSPHILSNFLFNKYSTDGER